MKVKAWNENPVKEGQYVIGELMYVSEHNKELANQKLTCFKDEPWNLVKYINKATGFEDVHWFTYIEEIKE